ncbi:sec-independent protein translocase protein TatB [Streptomyces spiroverticillatus]|uniref:Sec-independent protein translocase protein TatB n=1 Tax=Streptomyces finlayi TaxID=67296 RepID=A0A918WSK9_9ACTN|nr:sec-independent translocase [Streptomyces finlayi]GGZ85829.1 sec-independent protein translocase protein TatB [Streptomyces spiroverticillatus]GHC77394.1 sec-independent protein translocase protein TatB [Streptomyces finlayi]
MFSDIGGLELLTLAVLAVLIFGPDKLPKLIQDVTRTIRKIREFSDSAKQDIRSELGPEFKDFEFEDLNPKNFVRKQLAEHGGDDLGLKEIRESFDLRGELQEVTDVVNGKARPTARTPSDEPVAEAPKADLTKKPETAQAQATAPAPAPANLRKEERPVFDPDTT